MLNDTAMASQLLSGWNKTNRVDENYAKFFTWTLKRRCHITVDLNEVEALAQSCPQTDGNVVFAARNLYNALAKKHRLFTAACDAPANRQQHKKAITPVAIREKLHAITVYPNPAGSFVTVTGNTITKVELVNIYGAGVYKNSVKAGSITIPLTGFAKGVYIIKITTTDKKVTTRKIIKVS